MFKKTGAFVSAASILVTLYAFQNCGPGDGFGSKTDAFFDTETGTFSSVSNEQRLGRFNVNQGQDGSLLPEVSSGRWELFWADEFNGPSGQRPRKPWSFNYQANKDNRHRQGVLTQQDAFLDGNSNLKMQVVLRNGEPNSSYLRTTPYGLDNYKLNQGMPDSLLLGPTNGALYIEASVRLDKAFQTEDAWWAFWLFSPKTFHTEEGAFYSPYQTYDNPHLDPYDGNPQTGMEVDIFEYVPYLGASTYESRNGFNSAVFTSVEPERSQHINYKDKGFIGNINDFMRAKTIAAPIMDLTDGSYHKVGLYWSKTEYSFYINGIKFWQITNPNFITRTDSLALVLSWEVENGLWGDHSGRTFKTHGGAPYVLIDYVRVFQLK